MPRRPKRPPLIEPSRPLQPVHEQQALQDQKTYDELNYRDDQFDLSDAAIAIVIAVLAVTALTQLWPLYWAAWVPTSFGLVMGMAGLAGWQIHPEMLVKLLT